MKPAKETIAQAAQRLGVSYEIARRMLLRGELHGELVAQRWWVVDSKSVDRAIRKRQNSDVATAVA